MLRAYGDTCVPFKEKILFPSQTTMRGASTFFNPHDQKNTLGMVGGLGRGGGASHYKKISIPLSPSFSLHYATVKVNILKDFFFKRLKNGVDPFG